MLKTAIETKQSTGCAIISFCTQPTYMTNICTY